MPSSEIYSRPTPGEESAAEIFRLIYEKRGEKVKDAIELEERKKLLEEREKLLKELDEVDAEIASLEDEETPDDIDGTSEDGAAPEVDETEDDEEADEAEETEETEDSEETDDTEIEKTKEKAKKHKAFKKAMAAAGALALAGIMTITTGGGKIFNGLFGHKDEAKLDTDPSTDYTETLGVDDLWADVESRLGIETNPYTGELQNGVKYDYTEYTDFENKSSKNAFGYDKSAYFGDRKATADAFIEMASKAPEYLASYIGIFTEEEKAELGISGMTDKELDDYLSNPENTDAGEKQRLILEKMNEIVHDEENTTIVFYHEYGTEETEYIYFVDRNGDGKYAPNELTIGRERIKRNGAPQARILRKEKFKLRKDKFKLVSKLDLNMNCGLQTNKEVKVSIKGKTPAKHEEITGGGEIIDSEQPQEIIGGGENTDTDSDQETPQEITGGGENIDSDSDPTPRRRGHSETIKQKDVDNTIKIDKKINEDIAEDIDTKKVEITKTEDVTKVEEITDAPKAEEYHKPEAVGDAQKEANKNETPVDKAPTSGTEIKDILSDVGIN